MENLLKNQIENTRFKLMQEKFKHRSKKILGKNYAYFLNYNGKFIYLGLQKDIERVFRKILKDAYNTYYFISDVPDNYFKRYIERKFKNQTRITKKINKKKQGYYKKLAIQGKKTKIKRLREEIKRLNKGILEARSRRKNAAR